jgi:hypothetical protein
MKAIISAKLLASPETRPAKKPFEVWDQSLRGFILRIQPTGVRVHVVQPARGRRVTIGGDGRITPAAARLRAKRVLGNVANDLAPFHGMNGSSQSSLGGRGCVACSIELLPDKRCPFGLQQITTYCFAFIDGSRTYGSWRLRRSNPCPTPRCRIHSWDD